ncbi:hypothetical protein [Isoptericola croceus]|uniref:hypothetical protein n=1 Tax=Isoptericola croceus TaxID=3031406 RepID=UPI0023F99B9B|nr:hypothetical protein [Isoptericola croceus]
MNTAGPAVDPRRATVILVALAASTFLFVTLESLPAGLLTLMAPDLGRPTSQIGLLVTAYALVVLVSSVPLAHVTRALPRRFVFLMVTTVLVVTGAFGVITFVTQYLINVAGFSQADLPPLLLLQGGAGVVGALVVGRFLDRRPVGAFLVGVCVLVVALVGLWAFGGSPVGAVACLTLFGFAFSTVPPVLSHRVLLAAPRGTNMGQAVSSSLFNLGIAAGSGLGAVLVSVVDVRAVPLVSAAVVLLALLVALAEERWCAPLDSVARKAVDEVVGEEIAA